MRKAVEQAADRDIERDPKAFLRRESFSNIPRPQTVKVGPSQGLLMVFNDDENEEIKEGDFIDEVETLFHDAQEDFLK
jgi:hypothetical protein